MRVVFFDIDGVLADCSHRLHYQKEKDYVSFYKDEELAKDKLIEDGKELLETFCFDYNVRFVTGRPERTRQATLDWLEKNIPKCSSMFFTLEMRENGDHRPSDIVKREIIERHFEEALFGCSDKRVIAFFVDDDPKNCKAIDGMSCNLGRGRVVSLLFGAKRLNEEKLSWKLK